MNLWNLVCLLWGAKGKRSLKSDFNVVIYTCHISILSFISILLLLLKMEGFFPQNFVKLLSILNEYFWNFSLKFQDF